MPAEINKLKSTLKRGPHMSRQMRAEFILAQADKPPRSLTPAIIEKIKKELERLDRADKPAHVRAFCERMRRRYPELLAK